MQGALLPTSLFRSRAFLFFFLRMIPVERICSKRPIPALMLWSTLVQPLQLLDCSISLFPLTAQFDIINPLSTSKQPASPEAVMHRDCVALHIDSVTGTNMQELYRDIHPIRKEPAK